MKDTGMKLFACFAMAIMLISIAPAAAIADADGIQEKIQDRDRINATMDMSGNEIATQLRQNMTVRERYGEATENFLRIKANNSALNTEVAIEATKEYLNSTIDIMIETLDNDEYTEELNAIKEDVADATTRAELAEAAQDIRDIWKEACEERNTSAVTSINNKMTAVIRTSQAMALRLENEIMRMEARGEDVTELEGLLEQYNAHIAEAEQYQEQARSGNGQGQMQSVQNMRQAGTSMRQANGVLEEMLMELKQYREGLVTLTGDGVLSAEGDGIAVISGNFTMSFNADNATLVIKDMAGDAEVDIEDATYGYSNIDAGNSDVDNRAYVYHNLTGDVIIEGTRLTVTLRGTDITLDVEGSGNMIFTGEGTYEVEGVEKEWTAPEVDDEENTEENDE
ncbi:hypothetical protein [Methanolobus vulcani]|uniref:Uncharacterized protein n=1 Tax=Methanolobus vulcani TaxID=38026 RepID=A0A7Z8KRD8_9EURY|nr:hypothetical protein [Methanolobus vulcani]TQD27627.1 hypothetical protein FKV42_02900 [Methanolobus vulcani]